LQRDSEKHKSNKFKDKYMMVRIDKYKFEVCYESVKTSNIGMAIKHLVSYRCIGNNLWLSTKFAGQYVKVYFIDVNENPVTM
jgi:hypothetical protein